MKASGADLAQALMLSGANLVFLGHQTYLMIDAITRSLYRLFVSRKNLLEWTTAAQSQTNSKSGILASLNLMLASVAIGFFAIAAAEFRTDNLWVTISPFAIAWVLAPLAAYRMSLSPKLEDALEASPEDRKSLRLIARRTWKYFESFVTATDSMLPPDNFQEIPKPTVAHRTSPTNIGLYLLSIASAREFGWIGLKAAVEKLEVTLATTKSLEKYRGHLYNWYDTTTLAPLEPKYVSTVDSGNLAGHLITLSRCLTYWTGSSLDSAACMDGIGDVLNIIDDDLTHLPNDRSGVKSIRRQFEAELVAFRRVLNKTSEAPEPVAVRLIELAVQSSKAHAAAARLAVELSSACWRQSVGLDQSTARYR